LDGRAGFGGGEDGYDLALHQVAPLQHPLLEKPQVVAFHHLEATVEVGLNPAPNIGEAVRHLAALLAQAAVDRLGVAILEALDDHKVHAGPPARTLAPVSAPGA